MKKERIRQHTFEKFLGISATFSLVQEFMQQNSPCWKSANAPRVIMFSNGEVALT